MNRRDNTDIPRHGGIIQFQNGMIGQVISLGGTGGRQRIEANVDGTRVYIDVCDIDVISILDRMVQALNKEDNG